MRRVLLTAAVVIGSCFMLSSDAFARGPHTYSGYAQQRSGVGISLQFGSPYSSRYNSYYGGSQFGGHYGGHYGGHQLYRPHYDYHDTSHYDYHPGGYQPHGNHYDYVPGHYDFHRSGHYDYHR